MLSGVFSYTNIQFFLSRSKIHLTDFKYEVLVYGGGGGGTYFYLDLAIYWGKYL